MRLLTTGTTPAYFALLDGIGQAAIATSSSGTITHWNDSAEQLYGWTRAEVLGRDILDVTPAEMSRSQAAEIMTTLAKGHVWSGAFQVRGRSGDSFLVNVTDVPLIDDADRVVGVAGVSARPTSETYLKPFFERFAAAASGVWPHEVIGRSSISANVVTDASEPHLAQLLALLLLRYEKSMTQEGTIEVELQTASRSIFDAFGLPVRPAAHIRISQPGPGTALRDEVRSAFPTRFAASLVRAIGGVLLSTVRAHEYHALHLLLPVRSGNLLTVDG